VDKERLIGRIETVYELHSFHGDSWLLVRDASDLRQLEPTAALLVQRNEVDGIRLVRRVDYLDHEFSATVTIVKRLRSGVQETDPLARANPGRDASWCDKPDDFMGDIQRQVIRSFFAKYLDERRLTPLEILSLETHAKALDSAGTIVQGALQRLASVQVRGTKQTAVARMKELMGLADAGLAQLLKEAKGNAPAKIGERGLLGLSLTLGTSPSPEEARRAYRILSAHLADAKTWVEKLDRLFLLATPDLDVARMRLIDSMAAEILASPLALKELAAQEGNRLQLVLNAVDLYVGNLARDARVDRPKGVQTLSGLLAAGTLPRTLAELRTGLLRHLHARLPFSADGGIRDEMRGTVEILKYLGLHAPALAKDEEVLEALAQRADRLIQPEAMSELIGPIRGALARMEAVLLLIEQAPGDAPKAKIATYLRSLVVPEDFIRESGSRMEAVKKLLDIARRIQDAGMPAAPKREMVEILDNAAFDAVRTEILSNQNMTFSDRMLAVLRLCTGAPDGKTKQLASEQLTQALKRPEFLLNYLERFPKTQERRDAYLKLSQTLNDSGLVDKSIVPMP
jgi:hypothetical protein